MRDTRWGHVRRGERWRERFKAAWGGRPPFNSSQQLLLWTFLSGKQVPAPSWSTTYSDLMMLSRHWASLFVWQDLCSGKPSSFQLLSHESPCWVRMPSVSLMKYAENESPTRTASLHHYSECQCKIKDVEGCWKTNSWVKMEKFCQEIHFLCFFTILY